MNSQTHRLKECVRRGSSLAGKLDVLRNAYQGETAYLLTCGPSFGRFTPAFLQDRLRGELVLAVKQTYDAVGPATDFHLLNAWNYQAYTYAQPDPIIVFENHRSWPETPGLIPDLQFDVYYGYESTYADELKQRLCITCRFEDYLFDRRLDRPWGPGVVYELGVYLALHLGVRKIVAVGWDIGKPKSRHMPHFYREGENQELALARNVVRGGQLYDLDTAGQFVTAGKSADAERLLNIPSYIEDEVMHIANSTEALYQWLKGRDVALEIVSDSSLAAPCIPRTSL